MKTLNLIRDRRPTRSSVRREKTLRERAVRKFDLSAKPIAPEDTRSRFTRRLKKDAPSRSLVGRYLRPNGRPRRIRARRRVDQVDTRRCCTDERHRDGRRTRILIFALAMFRVRPGVNWMLIAVGSWPYIRGTLSPSPPGAQGPKSYTPHVTPLCSATTTTTTVPPSERPPLPFGTDAPLPLLTLSTHTHVSQKRPSPSSTRAGLVLFLVLATSRLFFFSRIFAGTLTALRRCAILSLENDGHTDWPSWLPLASGAAGRRDAAGCAPFPFGAPESKQYVKTRLLARNVSREREESHPDRLLDRSLTTGPSSAETDVAGDPRHASRVNRPSPCGWRVSLDDHVLSRRVG